MRKDGLWPLLLWLALCFLLVVGVSGVLNAQETISPNSINAKVQSLKTNLEKLQTLLLEQRRLLDEAQTQQRSLEIALSDSQRALTQLTISLEQSQETSIQLSQSFDLYKSETTKQIRRLSIERWIYRGAVAAAVVVAIVSLVK